MLDRLKEYIVKNSYNINKSNFDIRITKTDVIWDNENKRGSNIREMFEIIDWQEYIYMGRLIFCKDLRYISLIIYVYGSR